jgi:hypothetical protein
VCEHLVKIAAKKYFVTWSPYPKNGSGLDLLHDLNTEQNMNGRDTQEYAHEGAVVNGSYRNSTRGCARNSFGAEQQPAAGA